jgi:hypothetical protein
VTATGTNEERRRNLVMNDRDRLNAISKLLEEIDAIEMLKQIPLERRYLVDRLSWCLDTEGEENDGRQLERPWEMRTMPNRTDSCGW